MDICLSPFAPEQFVSRDGFGRPVPGWEELLNVYPHKWFQFMMFFFCNNDFPSADGPTKTRKRPRFYVSYFFQIGKESSKFYSLSLLSANWPNWRVI